MGDHLNRGTSAAQQCCADSEKVATGDYSRRTVQGPDLEALFNGMMGNRPSSRPNQTDGITTRSPVWLLGTPYPMDSLQNEAVVMQPLIAHFRSLLWFTYRFGFDPEDIPPHESDAGWGCMMRSGQMLLG